MINGTTRAKALLLAATIPAVLVVGGCKSGGTAPATGSSISTITVSGADLPPASPESPADAAPVDDTCPTSNTTAFAKTKFVAHTGLAFGTFHQWLWKPYQAGTFKQGANGRVMAFVKAGGAALFIKRQIRLATQDVKASPALCKAIAAPLAKVGDLVQGAYTKLRGGDPTAAGALQDLQNSISSVETQASHAGDPITESAAN